MVCQCKLRVAVRKLVKWVHRSEFNTCPSCLHRTASLLPLLLVFKGLIDYLDDWNTEGLQDHIYISLILSFIFYLYLKLHNIQYTFITKCTVTKKPNTVAASAFIYVNDFTLTPVFPLPVSAACEQNKQWS